MLRYAAWCSSHGRSVVAAHIVKGPQLLIRATDYDERLARQMAARFPLALAEIPFAFPVMREMLQYQRAREADEGLRWLRGELKSAVAGSMHN